MAIDFSGIIGKAFGGFTQGAGGVSSAVSKYLPAVIIGVVFAFIAVKFVENIIFFKHKVKLKRVIGNSLQWFEDKAMEKRLKNGAKIWYLKKLKIKKSIPPDSVLMQDSKGKIVAEGYLLNDNQIVWCKDDFSIDKISEKLKDIVKRKDAGEKLTMEEEDLRIFKLDFQPVSTNDRIVLADAMQEADFGKKDLHKLIEKFLPYGIILIFFVLLLFGFKYYAGPLNDYSKQALATVEPVAELNKLTAEYLYAIDKDVQLMQTDVTFLRAEFEKGVNNTG